MPIPVKLDYSEEALALVRQFHKGKTRLGYLIRTVMGQCQELELALQAIQQPYDTTGATGDKLDQIGAMVGAYRNGLDDDTFRLLIIGTIAARRSTGTLGDILTVAKKLFQSRYVYAYAPTSAGAGPRARGGEIGIMVSSPKLPKPLYPLAAKLLTKCLPAAVSMGFLGTFSDTAALAFAGSEPYVGGLGSTKDPAIGAPLGGLLPTGAY